MRENWWIWQVSPTLCTSRINNSIIQVFHGYLLDCSLKCFFAHLLNYSCRQVRKATHLNYELSKVAINVVLRGLHELMPVHSLQSVQSLLAGELSMSARVLDSTHDARRLRLVLQELVSCKEDAQQRSWELYEDEAVISEYLHELISILVSTSGL